MSIDIKDNFTGRFEGDDPNINVELKFLTASSIIGDKVHDQDDKHMGHIKDIMIDVRSGKIEYYVIEFGGFLGIGENPRRGLGQTLLNKQTGALLEFGEQIVESIRLAVDLVDEARAV